MCGGQEDLHQGLTSGSWLVSETSLLPQVLSLPPTSFCGAAWEASSESSLHSPDYTGRHSTEDLLGGKRSQKKEEEEEGKSQNISWGEAGRGRKALLPLDKGENYFISFWSSKACER